ncbi:MAG: hypothetical protein M1818_004244 [Claussenomyces sp. TS43310]|nr:MAG: hypothetical protein M1818_004244 [Claussenomyces sp. TS43310]
MEEQRPTPAAGGIGCHFRARKQRFGAVKKTGALLSIAAALPAAMAQSCISLSGSSQCPAFNTSSISTDSTLVGLFPFLSSVTDTSTFDKQLAAYVSTSYVESKYERLLGCSGIELTNTSNLYARWTTTVVCNSIVQNSITPCSLTSANSRPVCAESCSEYAESEANVIADNALCTNPSKDAQSQIRADFTNCALPGSSLDNSCIQGAINEPENCGYGTSLIGLCSYCASGTVNSTDTCCYNSQAETRCAGVVLPTITASISLITSTATATSSPTSSPTSSTSKSSTPSPTSAAAIGGGSHLSGGDIAGIVIGSIAGLAVLIAFVLAILICLRRRRGSQQGSVFNQPTPPRQATGMAYNPVGSSNSAAPPDGYEVLPGGRITRMSALEGHSGDSPTRGQVAAVGAGSMAAGQRRHHEQSSSSEFGGSPESDTRGGILRPPPPTNKRNGSLSSGSALGAEDPNSPYSGSGNMSSPQGLASQQSEQLAFFKDYYSQDEIRPGDKVATLWAYQPRAGDEFPLERGDMLKVVGIWDDGWATGVMIDDRADDWEASRNAQRDSGVSNGSGVRRDSSPVATGEIKAFPLVCVCLPEHWRKTIEGDGSTETGSSGPPAHS